MKAKIYREYINKEYLQKTILLGDVFGVKVRNIDARTREDKPYRIYFTNGKKIQGFIDERVRYGLSEKYFELKTPLGKVMGDFDHTLNPSIHFSLSISGKSYDTISGFYNASIPKFSFDISNIRQIMRCSLEKNQELMQSVSFYDAIEFGQCYRYSPEPYEHLLIQTNGVSEFTLLHKKGFDKYNRSMLTKSKILQKDSTIRMVKPIEFTVECSNEKNDSANLELDKIYDILSSYDDGITPCLDYFHKLLIFDKLDLYQNMVSACFSSYDNRTTSYITGVEKKAYQKNLALVSRLNAQR